MDLREFADNIRSKSELFAEVVGACRSLLKTSIDAKCHYDYIKTRLSDESIENWDIGYFPPNDKLHLLTERIGKESLRELNLIYDYNQLNRSHYDLVTKGILNSHNIIFPYCDEYGNIVTLAGRTILNKEERSEMRIPKYKNIPFPKQMHLFGLLESGNAIENKNGVIVVEGQIDCISCHSKGFKNTVALTGSDLTMHQVFLLKRKTNNIYLLLDNDEAGQKATAKIIKNYSQFINISALKLPDEYGDIDEYLKESNEYDLLNIS